MRGKNAFLFGRCLPCTLSIGDTQYFYRTLDDIRNSESSGIFKETLLNILKEVSNG